jgi:hypothetical protein
LPVVLAHGQRGAGVPAVVAGLLHKLAVALGAGGANVEGKDDLRAAVRLVRGGDMRAQLAQELGRIVVRRHRRGRALARLFEGPGIEDALGKPDAGRVGEVFHGQVGPEPRLPLVGLARGEMGLAVKPAGLVDQAFPPASARQREADGGRADAPPLVAEIFLRIGIAHAHEVEPARIGQIGIGGGMGVFGVFLKRLDHVSKTSG